MCRRQNKEKNMQNGCSRVQKNEMNRALGHLCRVQPTKYYPFISVFMKTYL